MRVLIDSDTIAFASAATAEDTDEWIAHARANEMVERIITATGADDYELWLTGDGNFRYNIYPEYKANRLSQVPPKWYKSTKQFLVKEWNANWSEGCEADDMVGVRQMELKDSIISHIDKDIDTIPGWHHNWELTRQGKVIREARKYYLDDFEATKKFYYQLIVGDPTDGIKGIPGKGPKAAEWILSGTNEVEWYQSVKENYSSSEEMELNAQVLWIWRKMNDNVLERFNVLEQN